MRSLPPRSIQSHLAHAQALFTTYGFHFPLAIAVLQTAFMIPFCYLSSRPALDLKVARSIVPLALVNVLNMVTGVPLAAGSLCTCPCT